MAENTVPEKCRFTADFRFNNEEQRKEVDDIKLIYSLGASDTADLTQMGITCPDGFGTEGGNIHGLGEFAYIESLTESAKRLASVAYCIE